MNVQLSYEEQIINALSRLPRKRGEHFTEHDRRQFDAIRAILAPLYGQVARQINVTKEELAELRIKHRSEQNSRFSGFCVWCHHPWPCPTIRLVESAPTEGVE